MATFFEHRLSATAGAEGEHQQDAHPIDFGPTPEGGFHIHANIATNNGEGFPAGIGSVGFYLGVFEVERLYRAARSYLREHGDHGASFLEADELANLPVGAAVIVRRGRHDNLAAVTGHDADGHPLGRVWYPSVEDEDYKSGVRRGGWTKHLRPLSAVIRVASRADGQAYAPRYLENAMGQKLTFLYAEDLGLREAPVWEDHPTYIDWFITDFCGHRLVVNDRGWQAYQLDGEGCPGLPVGGNNAESIKAAKAAAVAWAVARTASPAEETRT